MNKEEQKQLFKSYLTRYSRDGFHVFESEIDTTVQRVLGKNGEEWLLNLLVDITLDLDRWDLAFPLIQEGLGRFATCSVRLNNMGVCLAELNRNEEAYDYLKKSLVICQDQLTLKVACELSAQLEKFDEAVSICRAYYESSCCTRHACLWYAYSLIKTNQVELAKIVINEYTSRHGLDGAFSDLLSMCD